MLLKLIDLIDGNLERLNLTIQETTGGRFAIVLTGIGSDNGIKNTKLVDALRNNLYIEGTKTELLDGLSQHIGQYSEALGKALISNTATSINNLEPSEPTNIENSAEVESIAEAGGQEETLQAESLGSLAEDWD